LIGIDAVAFPHLGGTDARHLAGAHREENGRPFRGQLEGVEVSACYHRSPTLFLLRRCRREKVICLVARCLRVGQTARADEFREEVELIEQRVVELAAALI
jgi:hypothetical protein